MTGSQAGVGGLLSCFGHRLFSSELPGKGGNHTLMMLTLATLDKPKAKSKLIKGPGKGEKKASKGTSSYGCLSPQTGHPSVYIGLRHNAWHKCKEAIPLLWCGLGPNCAEMTLKILSVFYREGVEDESPVMSLLGSRKGR